MALEDWKVKLSADNANAKWMAETLIAQVPGITVHSPELIETNIFRFSLKKQKDHMNFCSILREEYGILASPSFANDAIRLVTHRDVSRD